GGGVAELSGRRWGDEHEQVLHPLARAKRSEQGERCGGGAHPIRFDRSVPTAGDPRRPEGLIRWLGHDGSGHVHRLRASAGQRWLGGRSSPSWSGLGGPNCEVPGGRMIAKFAESALRI